MRIKILEPFEATSKHSLMINAILISYGCVFRPYYASYLDSNNESIEEVRNEYKKLLKEW